MPVSAGESKIQPCIICGSYKPSGVQYFKPALDCGDFSFVRCVHCNLVQRNPQPVKEEIIARYSSIYGKDYLKYELENEENFLKLQQFALNDAGFTQLEKFFFNNVKTASNSNPMDVSPTDVNPTDANPTDINLTDKYPTVLDIGCATGALLAVLRGRGWRVTGVEISPSAAYARDERKLDVRSLPLEENNFPSGSFDVILASHLIEHLNNPHVFLTETCRILKNSGYIFITTPNIDGFQSRLFGSRWRSAIFDHLYLFSRLTLSKLLKNTGFSVVSCNTWGGLAAGMAPKWLKKTADFLAKRLNFGDVMIIRARKA